MFNVYRRISKKNVNGKVVLARKLRINSNEIDSTTVGEWFKCFENNLKTTFNVRTVITTAFSKTISVLTEDGTNLIFEYWVEAAN